MADPNVNPPTDPGQPPAEPIDPEAQRAWLAQVDRKLGTRTYAGAAALILALAAAIVAIVLAIDARDNSATDADLNQVEQQISSVAKDASASQDAQEGIDSLGGRLDSVEDQISGLESADTDIDDRLEVIEDDIEALRQQISDSSNSSEGQSGGGGSGGVGNDG